MRGQGRWNVSSLAVAPPRSHPPIGTEITPQRAPPLPFGGEPRRIARP